MIREKHGWTYEQIGRLTVAQMIDAISESPLGMTRSNLSDGDAEAIMESIGSRKRRFIERALGGT